MAALLRPTVGEIYSRRYWKSPSYPTGFWL